MKDTVICTHNGKFHADDVLACYIASETAKIPKIIRSRDPNTIEQSDIVVDVGGVFDPNKSRFDHHMKGFSETFNGKGVKLSSAGLVWKYNGKAYIKKYNSKLCDSDVDLIHQRLYSSFIEEIDAVDNGITKFFDDMPHRVNTGISTRISHMNPAWNEHFDEDLAFTSAMKYIGNEFFGLMRYMAKSWLPARIVVQEAYGTRMDFHKSGKLIHLKTECPWKSEILAIDDDEKILFCINEKNGIFRVTALPGKEPFSMRVPLPAAWRGLRPEELKRVSGISDIIFVHHSGFTGGASSIEGAKLMAEIAMGQK